MSDVPPTLAALYASERAAAGAPDADRARIRTAVLASVGVAVTAGGATSAGAATGAGTVAGGIAGKLVIVLVTLGAIGSGTALLSRDSTRASPASREPVAALAGSSGPIAAPPSTAPTTPSISPPAAPPARASSTPPASTPRTTRSSGTRVTMVPPAAELAPAAPIESDVQRLARAVALSERGDAAGALALLETVASTSAVAEERDALRVMALAKLGRTDEACAAVAVFVARFPHSIHRAAVEEVPCPGAR